MTRYDIIRMAEQSQMNLCWGDVVFTGTSNLERFAALVAAAEREACAKICDKVPRSSINQAEAAAKLIRLRK